MNIPTAGGQLGSGIGDAIATAQGVGEMVLGAGGNIGGLMLDATGVGAIVGVPAAVSTAAMVHGGATALTGATNMMKAHGNTAGSQPAELYKKSDKEGNLEKHGVSQDASKRYSKTEVGEGKVTVTDRGPRKEMLAKERHKVETNPGPKNREPWAGKKKDQ